MRLRITKRQSDYLGREALDELNIGISKSHWGWQTEQFVDLEKMSGRQFEGFVELLKKNKHVRGIGALYTDVTVWKESFNADGADNRKAMGCQQFFTFARKVIGELPHHYLFRRAEDVPGTYHAYYVKEIVFHPKKRVKDGDGGWYTIPEHTDLKLEYSRDGGKQSMTLQYERGEVQGEIVKTVLAKDGWLLETPERYEAYMKDVQKYIEMAGSIGKQYNAFGSGELFSESDSRRRYSWDDDAKSGSYMMEKDGEPSKVVIDVFSESEKTEKAIYGSLSYVEEGFWLKEQLIKENLASKEDVDPEEDIEERQDLVDEENRDTRPRIPLPHHLYLVIFDLKRHLRFTIHMAYLEEYKYDTSMGANLILPEDQKTLVTMLTDHNSAEFTDIVKGKSGGSIVLLCGAPGTGKTLTAEVLAESEKKPLFSVQASQLGTSVSDLETNLLRALGRAKRWGAIMLLDESDVYIHQRGDDLKQNAIVGVFLRVLEYYTSVLFLTTNRPDDVDDAVASRCIAKIVYGPFETEEMKLMAWKTLARVSKTEIEESELVKLSKNEKKITGRDMKNLLKLAKLYAKARGVKVTADVIEFVRRFKPTA